VTSVRALAIELRESRRRGYTLVDQEQHPAVSSVGVPLLDGEGVAIAAVAVQGPSVRITPERHPTIVEQLAGAAAELSTIPGLQLLASRS
jgi:DNA-binding IclR family transcriptional regulator